MNLLIFDECVFGAIIDCIEVVALCDEVIKDFSKCLVSRPFVMHQNYEIKAIVFCLCKSCIKRSNKTLRVIVAFRISCESCPVVYCISKLSCGIYVFKSFCVGFDISIICATWESEIFSKRIEFFFSDYVY